MVGVELLPLVAAFVFVFELLVLLSQSEGREGSLHLMVLLPLIIVVGEKLNRYINNKKYNCCGGYRNTKDWRIRLGEF